ncbi:PD-(D/E)XK nuclease family protein [Rhizohabitans arisaemae]|uniref:PD-(D/E)XK nuclease family protein n=1 Tax=Rhizohabitans arisaemae TaxID=2720610 RepID=UPI0024B066C1|nr:PD-(D/E)XK nuclease family protein [Rhizohabitans arisaemae]
MSRTLHTALTGNPGTVRLSASMLDRSADDCGDFAAAKARPQMWPSTGGRRRYAPWETFPLGLVMSVLDAVEFGGADPAAATAAAIEGNRNPVHPGAAAWIAHACDTYLEAAESLAAELAADGVPIEPERHPRIVQGGASPAEMRALTAWGRWYGSPDGTVVEFRRLRMRHPIGTPDTPSTLAMGYIAAAGHRAANPQDVYRTIPVPLLERGPRPERVRVVEIGLTGGGVKVLLDGSPEDVHPLYRATAVPVASGLLDGGPRSPGRDCAECKLLGSCDTLAHTPGLLGLRGRGTHRRTWSMTTDRQYQICPAQAHLRELHIPGAEPESTAVRRGLLVHRWLEVAHSRPGAPACTRRDLPAPGEPDLGLAEPLMAPDEYREILPFLRNHLPICPLDGPGPITEVVPEPRVASYDAEADVVVIASPDLLRRAGGELVYREQKTSDAHRGITAENALELVPQLALAVCLIADGALGPAGDSGGRVELEQLTPVSGDLITLRVSDPGVLATARRIVSDRARGWHGETGFRATPGPWCRFCPVSRWCADAEPADSTATTPLRLDGMTIDPVTGEVLRDGPSSSRAEALAAAVTEPEDDEEPPF